MPYLKRLAVSSGTERAHATLAGVALALRALTRALGRDVHASELIFAPDEKPRLASPAEPARAAADFSVAHSGPYVGCAALRGGRVGLDVEVGSEAHLENWVAREAVVKAAGLGMRALKDVELNGAGARCRSEHWHARRLEQFAGAVACVMTSVAIVAVEARPVPLAELFAP